MAALKLLLPPPFSCDANQPPASCLVGADSISQGAHLLHGHLYNQPGQLESREGRAGKQGAGGELGRGGRGTGAWEGNLIRLAIRLASLSRWLYITALLQPSAPRPDAGQHRAGSVPLQAPSCFPPTPQPWIPGPEVAGVFGRRSGEGSRGFSGICGEAAVPGLG